MSEQVMCGHSVWRGSFSAPCGNVAKHEDGRCGVHSKVLKERKREAAAERARGQVRGMS